MTLFTRIGNETFSIINVAEFLENVCNDCYELDGARRMIINFSENSATI